MRSGIKPAGARDGRGPAPVHTSSSSAAAAGRAPSSSRARHPAPTFAAGAPGGPCQPRDRRERRVDRRPGTRRSPDPLLAGATDERVSWLAAPRVWWCMRHRRADEKVARRRFIQRRAPRLAVGRAAAAAALRLLPSPTSSCHLPKPSSRTVKTGRMAAAARRPTRSRLPTRGFIVGARAPASRRDGSTIHPPPSASLTVGDARLRGLRQGRRRQWTAPAVEAGPKSADDGGVRRRRRPGGGLRRRRPMG